VIVHNFKQEQLMISLCDRTLTQVSLLSEEKGKVLLRCYHYEEAFLAEIRVRETRNLSSTFIEEIYNYHRDGNYTHLTLSKAENLCCITFERPDHTLEEVFQSISPSNRSQKWVEKCWVVLRQIAEALKHIHDRNLIHGHLNPANISKYGNLWKLSHIGTVVPVGSPLRGLIRPCSPPESVISSPLALRDRVNLTRNQSFTSPDCNGIMINQSKQNHHNRVKFSSSVRGERKTLSSKAYTKKRNKTISLDSQPSTSELISIPNNEEKSNTFFNCRTWGECRGEFKEEEKDPNTFSCSALDNNIDVKIDHEGVIVCPRLFAPEKCIASPAWDMWGFGLVMVQLLLGRCTSLPNFEKADDAILRNLYYYDESTLKVSIFKVICEHNDHKCLSHIYVIPYFNHLENCDAN